MNAKQSTASLGGLLALGVAGFLAGRTVVRYRRRINLTGQIAIVTGGSRGIGLEICRQLVRKGTKLVICARREGELRAAQEELEQLGGDVLAVVCDVTHPEDVGNVVQQAIDHFGRIDILINVAGIIITGPFSHMKLDDYRRVMDTNFFGALHFLLAVTPEMRRRKAGRIVNIASLGGKVPGPHAAPYTASKYALVGLSETLRIELANNGVYVTTVNPGFIRDGAMINAVFKGDHEAEKSLGVAISNAPLMSIDPRRLARQIIDALEHGDAELTTPFLPRTQALFHGALPSISQELLAWANRLLPHRAAGGDRPREGSQVSDADAPAWARARERAAEKKYQGTNPRTA